jgi:hypothetical protein
MVKNFTLIALTCFLITLFGSCTKDPESTVNPGGTSIYSFVGNPGSCATATVAGIYSVGRIMNASNTITFTVNVTAKGTYSINTTGSNGVWFSGSGTFAGTGPQTVVLTGNGTPIKAGNFSFVPVTNNTCNFTVSFLDGLPAAIFTYAGAPSACSAPAITGSYGIGVALGSGNYVDLGVNVTTTGAYTISTNSANGINFSGSGAFTATGAQVVRLIGNGTPTSSGSFAYTPSSGCSFTINVTTAGGTSIYTLDCSTPVISGTYTAGATLGAGNTVTIKANVTTAGTYSINTPSINGMTFSSSGTFAVGTGQTIVLTGTGTPASAGTNNFTAGSGGCSFSITTVAPPPAVYTLTCNGTSVTGSYVTGTALTASNKVDVEVNVTTAGAYTITSTTLNGMTFSKTGVFTTTGTYNVTLTGSGTPVSVGTNNFTVGIAACPFDVTVTAPTSPCSGLVDGIFVMTGQFTINGFSFGASLGGQYQVSIQNGSGLKLDAFFPGNNPPTPGIYSIGTVTMRCLYIAGTTAVDWNATSGLVYVSSAGGQTVVEFCNVNFTGTILFPGGTVTSTGAGKMVF